MSTYQLKKSQADLTDFFAAVFSQQYKDVFGRQNSQEKAGAFVLSIEEGQILAALSYQLLYQTIKVSDLAVLPSHQKQGLGTWLLKALKAEAEKHQVLNLILTTRSYQAKDFYLKQGFAVFGMLKDVPFASVDTYYMVYHCQKDEVKTQNES